MDVLVVGGGIAGCALIWQCRTRGMSAVLIDAPQPNTASRVAAGLVTPLTGSRLALSWRWSEFFPVADTLYRRAENETGSEFWGRAPAWRVFTSEKELEFCRSRWLEPSHGESEHADLFDQEGLLEHAGVQVRQLDARALPGVLARRDGISMAPAARLNPTAYLDATRRLLDREGMLISMDLHIDSSLQPCEQGIEIPTLGVKARWVVLCQGMRARSNRWFASLPLHPARGDILRIRSRQLHLDRVLHHDGWIVPLGEGDFLIGATYDRLACDPISVDDPVSVRWRSTLERRWEAMTGESIGVGGTEVVEHRIAVRPASYDRHPLIGQHSELPPLYCFNGLGSKGSLMAPWVASHLLDTMLGNGGVESCLRWNRTRRGK